MASIDVHAGWIAVRLTPWEHFIALHEDVVVPRASLRGAEVLDEPMKHLPRWRSLGTAFPGLAFGTFRQRGRKEFVAVRKRQPAVRVHLAEETFTALVVSVEDPERVAAAIAALVL